MLCTGLSLVVVDHHAVGALYPLGLHVHMDDFFGWDFTDNLLFFHGQWQPQRQVQLLILWDSILCPYEDKKQVHGETLKIIRFWVDSVYGSISLTPDTVSDILSKIKAFLEYPG